MEISGEKNQIPSINEAQIRALLASEKGKMLASLFQADRNTLKKAADAIKSGKTDDAKQLLSPLVASDEIQTLLKQLFGEDGSRHG